MNRTLSLVTPPTVEPVVYADAKTHMRIEAAFTTDDAYITSLLTAAKDQVEDLCSIRLITQTWKWTLDDFMFDRRFMQIPLAPLASVSSVKYTDSSGALGTMPDTDYIVDAVSKPGRIVLKDSASWPTATLRAANGVEITFICGYGAAGTNCPARLLQAIKFLTAHWYENREPVLVGNISAQKLPDAFHALIAQFKMWPL